MSDIDQLMHRFRDYVEPMTEPGAATGILRSIATTSGAARRLLRPALVAVAGALAIGGVAVFLRASAGSNPQVAQGPATPTWGAECDIAVTPKLGESQRTATDRALRVLDARARAVDWTSYRFKVTSPDTITARVQAARCDYDLAGLTVTANMAISDLSLAVATDLSGNEIVKAVRSLPAGGAGTKFLVVSADSQGMWNVFTTPTQSTADQLAGQTRRSQIVAVPNGYDVVQYEPSTARRPAAARARARRFAVIRRADDVLGPYAILNTRTHGSDLELDLTEQARAKVTARLRSSPRDNRARLLLIESGPEWTSSVGAVKLDGDKVIVDIPSTDPVVSRGYAASLAGGMLPSALKAGTPRPFGAEPTLVGEPLASPPAWVRAVPGQGMRSTFHRVIDTSLAGARWQVVVMRGEGGSLQAWPSRNGRPMGGNFETSCGSMLGAPRVSVCGSVSDQPGPTIGQIGDPSIDGVAITARSRSNGTEKVVRGIVSNTWFLVPPLPADYVARTITGFNAATGKIVSTRRLPDQGFLIMPAG